MKKLTLAIGILLTLAMNTFAESSLSATGFGSQYDGSSARSAGMGYSGIAVPDSINLDLTTPSSWYGIRMTKLGIGTAVGWNSVSDGSASDASSESGFIGSGLSMYVGKGIFVGMTLTPYTRVSYLWEGAANLNGQAVSIRQQGYGGITQMLIGAAFSPKPNLRLGLALRPIFGTITRQWKVTYTGMTFSGATEDFEDRYSGFGFTGSGLYSLGDWTLGVLVNSPIDASVERRMRILSDGVARFDATTIQPKAQGLPLDLTAGVGKQVGEQLWTGEFAWHGWGSVANSRGSSIKLKDGIRLSGGWEWKPSYHAFDSFWREITYRGGAFVEHGYALSPSGHQAWAEGITAGFGVPYAGGRSRLDIALLAKFSGDATKDGAAEKYFGIQFGFNHSELWFAHRLGE